MPHHKLSFRAEEVTCPECGATFDPDSDNSEESTEDRAANKPAATEATLANSLINSAKKSSKASETKARSGVWDATAKLAKRINQSTPAETNALSAAIKAERDKLK